MRTLEQQLAVYLVADPDQTQLDLVEAVGQALAGGVTAVQLRAKRQSDRDMLDLALRLRERCRKSGALFIVNDRLDIALASEADGVHLGVNDLPLLTARHIAGQEFVIGYSPETDEQARAAPNLGADYVGVGPAYATASKDDAGAALEPAVFRNRVRIASIPAVGIGGITVENAPDVIRAGAIGVAVISAILRSPDPGSAAASLAGTVLAALDSRV